MPQIDLTLVFAVLKWLAYGALAVYIVVAVGLSMLAARLGMRGGWMAWVPVLNLFLLCRMARSSFVWVLFALVPIAGLGALAYLGARVARRLGMSAAVGVLWGVPFLGALVPIPMALGRGELPEGASDGAPSRTPLVAGAVSLAVVTILASTGIGAFWAAGRMTLTAAPTAKAVAASLPANTASTLTEFPLDPDPVNPVKPTNLITQTFAKPSRNAAMAPQQVKIQARQLPPWIEPASLPAAAESVAAADYVSSNAGNAAPVSVVTMVMRDDRSAVLVPPSAATLAKSAPGARATGIEVKNTQGETYRGYRVSGGDSTYVAVNKVGTQVNVVISASEQTGTAAVDRLARNLGTGDGILDQGDYAGIFGELPAAPGGEAWSEVGTFTEADIEQMVRMVEQEAANMSEEDRAEASAFLPLISQVRTLAPKRVGFGYSFDAGGTSGYAAAVASYTNARTTWMVFKAAEMVKALVPLPEEVVIRPATIGDASGYFVSIRDGGFGYVLRHGSSIVGLAGGGDISEDTLRRWAEAHLARAR